MYLYTSIYLSVYLSLSLYIYIYIYIYISAAHLVPKATRQIASGVARAVGTKAPALRRTGQRRRRRRRRPRRRRRRRRRRERRRRRRGEGRRRVAGALCRNADVAYVPACFCVGRIAPWLWRAARVAAKVVTAEPGARVVCVRLRVRLRGLLGPGLAFEPGLRRRHLCKARVHICIYIYMVVGVRLRVRLRGLLGPGLAFEPSLCRRHLIKAPSG